MCKGQAVECMAVYKNFGFEKETMELWIGSGDASGQSQISWLNLIEDGTTVNNRCILCIFESHGTHVRSRLLFTV